MPDTKAICPGVIRTLFKIAEQLKMIAPDVRAIESLRVENIRRAPSRKD